LLELVRLALEHGPLRQNMPVMMVAVCVHVHEGFSITDIQRVDQLRCGQVGYNSVGFCCSIRRRMSKEDCIEVTGTVVEKFPSGLFSVQLDQDRTVLAHLAGKLRRNRIRVLAGDRVTMELSPYDLTKGRITYRHK
jgi:translation initiation factor IF-1